MPVVAFDTRETVRNLTRAGADEALAEAIAVAIRDAVTERTATGDDSAGARHDIVRGGRRIDKQAENFVTKGCLDKRAGRFFDDPELRKTLDRLATKEDIYFALKMQAIAIVGVLAAAAAFFYTLFGSG